MIDLRCGSTDQAQTWWIDRVYSYLDPPKKIIMIAFTIKTQAKKKYSKQAIIAREVICVIFLLLGEVSVFVEYIILISLVFNNINMRNWGKGSRANSITVCKFNLCLLWSYTYKLFLTVNMNYF